MQRLPHLHTQLCIRNTKFAISLNSLPSNHKWGEVPSHFIHEETEAQKAKELAQMKKTGSEAKIQTQLFPIPSPLPSVSWTSPTGARLRSNCESAR